MQKRMFQVMAFWQKLQRRVWLRLRESPRPRDFTPRLSRHAQLSLPRVSHAHLQHFFIHTIEYLSLSSQVIILVTPRVQQVRTTST